LDLRAKAAREMIPHSASQFPDEDGRAAASLYGQQIMSTSIDMASAAKAVAWSQLWDNDEVCTYRIEHDDETLFSQRLDHGEDMARLS